MMPRKNERDSLSDQQARLRNLIIRGNEFLCIEGKAGLGSWGETRRSSTSLWSICDCGLGELHPHFIRYCIQKLLTSRDANQTDDSLCFNDEVWDTSLALIALTKGGRTDFPQAIDKIKKWLLEEAMEDNWDNEPWETLWAITALLTVGTDLHSITPLIKRSVKWVLDRRTADGILISTHYTAFLLSVLNEVVKHLRLTKKEETSFNAAINRSLSYLKDEFLEGQRQESLWEDEPWIVGHVLLGIACTSKNKDTFLLDPKFNEYLVQWYEAQEWLPGHGWGDLVQTSFTLVGLTNYYIKREAELTGVSEVGKADIHRQLSSEVQFRFDIAEMPVQMTLRPRWRGRDFKVKSDEYFILMPYREQWSMGVNLLLRDILEDKRIKSKRADDMRRPDVIEDIWRGINESRIIIADCTGMNPNVLYELGVAHTVGKDVILLTQDISGLPFDIRGLRYITYTNDEEGFRKLKDILPKTIDEILRG